MLRRNCYTITIDKQNGRMEMDTQEFKNWYERNKECFSNEQEAREYVEKRELEQKTKNERELKSFNNLDEFHEFEKTNNCGEYWFDEDDFTTVHCYVYK